MSSSHAKCGERLIEATSQEIIDRIHDLVMSNIRLKLREISSKRVYNIVYQHLIYAKLFASTAILRG